MPTVFSDLYTRIEREVLKQTNTIYLTDVKNAIISAIRYYEHKPVWFTEVVGTDLSITSGTDNVSLPANFASMKSLRVWNGSRYLDETSGFEPVTFDELRRIKADNPNKTTTPSFWALWAGKVYVDSTVSTTTTAPIDYYKKDTSYPSGASDTSIWFEEGQDVIRFKAMAIFYRDRRHDENMAAQYDGGPAANFDGGLAGATFDNLTARSIMRRRIHRLA
jgi:hypothetical protein